MKRCLGLLLALAFSAALLPHAKAATQTITVYNWGQYISDGTDGYIDVIEAFTEATGIEVNYLTFDSNESLYTKLKTGGTTYDIIIPSDYMVAKLLEEDMLEPLDFSNIPNYQYIDAAFRDQAYDPENRYSVPYTWGTVGLIYNTKYVSDADAESWNCLWNPKYSGKILMFDNPRDSFAIAERILGYSLNTESALELQETANLLSSQKSMVQSYVMDQIYDKMEREEAWLAPYYAGDYLMMADSNPNLAFSYPKEGYNVFIDAMCIPKGCQNKAGAEAFINFLCTPEISGQNCEYLGYSTPETAAKAYIDESVAGSEIAYPTDETLARSEAFSNLSQEATQQMNDHWLAVKTAGDDMRFYLIITAAAAVLILALAGYLHFRKRRRLAQRCRKWKQNEL